MSVPAALARFNLINLIFQHALSLLSMTHKVHRINGGGSSNINFGEMPNPAHCPQGNSNKAIARL